MTISTTFYSDQLIQWLRVRASDYRKRGHGRVGITVAEAAWYLGVQVDTARFVLECDDRFVCPLGYWRLADSIGPPWETPENGSVQRH